MSIRRLQPHDLDWVLALNRVFETELSPLTAAQLAHLADQSFYPAVAEPEAGFLLTFDQGAAL